MSTPARAAAMRSRHRPAQVFARAILVFALTATVLAAAEPGASPTPTPDPVPTVPATPDSTAVAMPGLEVYDFTSDWDQNAMGLQAGRVLRGRARRLKQYAILVDMDREAVLQESPAPANYPDDLTAWVDHARKHFDTRLIAGGKLTGWDAQKKSFVMDLSVVDIGVKAADGTWPKPVVLIAKRFSVDADIYLPPLMEEVLTQLVGPHLARGAVTYPKVTASGPNLLVNGTFEALDDKQFALHWEDASMKKGMIATVARPVDPPVGATGKNTPAPASDPAAHCLQLQPDEDMATSYGLIAYSDLIDIQPDTAYQLGLNIRSHGPSVIIWVKGYSMVDGRLRNTYKHQKRFYPDEPGRWNAFLTEPFMPKHPKYPVTQVKVMLYAYTKAGTAWFDDVELHAVKVDGALPKADFEIPDRATSGWQQADGDHQPGIPNAP